jgi:hypothetical protein
MRDDVLVKAYLETNIEGFGKLREKNIYICMYVYIYICMYVYI